MDTPIGSREINRILLAIKGSAVAAQLGDSLYNLCLHLDATDKLKTLHPSITLGITDPFQALEEVIKFFVSKSKEEQPTVLQFVKALEDSKLMDYSRCVKKEFASVTPASSGPRNTSRPPSSISMVPEISTSSTVSLSFGESDLKNDVFPKLQSDILNILTDNTGNTQIILQLNKLELFDRVEIEWPLYGSFDTERKRILELTRLIQNLDADDILLCLQALCNLEELPKKRKSFRAAFERNFPGCCR